MESVLKRTNKVIVDSDSANNLMYLPLDKLMNRNTLQRTREPDTSSNKGITGTRGGKPPARPARRTRETR